MSETITFKELGGPFKVHTATNERGVLVATIRWMQLPRGKRWGVNSRCINGWRYFKTVAEAKAEITKVEESEQFFKKDGSMV